MQLHQQAHHVLFCPFAHKPRIIARKNAGHKNKSLFCEFDCSIQRKPCAVVQVKMFSCTSITLHRVQAVITILCSFPQQLFPRTCVFGFPKICRSNFDSLIGSKQAEWGRRTNTTNRSPNFQLIQALFRNTHMLNCRTISCCGPVRNKKEDI